MARMARLASCELLQHVQQTASNRQRPVEWHASPLSEARLHEISADPRRCRCAAVDCASQPAARPVQGATQAGAALAGFQALAAGRGGRAGGFAASQLLRPGHLWVCVASCCFRLCVCSPSGWLQTGFTRPGATKQYDYVLRRQALRASWFPASAAELLRHACSLLLPA